MADAIPSWTQPKPGEGNWDDVRCSLFLVLALACGVFVGPCYASSLSSSYFILFLIVLYSAIDFSDVLML